MSTTFKGVVPIHVDVHAGRSWLFPLEGERKPAPILKSRFNERLDQISPDGRWISYASDESGRSEVHVRSFPTPESKYQNTTTGCFVGLWSRSGEEMLVFGQDGAILSVLEKK